MNSDCFTTSSLLRTLLIAVYSPEEHGIILCGEEILPRHIIPEEAYDILKRKLAECDTPHTTFNTAFAEELAYVSPMTRYDFYKWHPNTCIQ